MKKGLRMLFNLVNFILNSQKVRTEWIIYVIYIVLLSNQLMGNAI